MIDRTCAQDRMVLLVHARKKLGEWLEARERAGRDPLYNEPRSDPEDERLAGELDALSHEVCAALHEAGRTSAFEILGESFPLLSRRCLDFDPRLGPRTTTALDDGIAFYRSILLAPQRSPSEAKTMADKKRRLDEKDAQRLRLLDAVYELTDGNSAAYTTYGEAYELAGLPAEDAEAAKHFLMQEGLLTGTAGHVSLTHAGVDERERALRNGGSRTDHFSEAAVHQVFNIQGSVGVLQTGDRSVARNIAQRVSHGGDGASLTALLKELRAEAEGLPGAEREEGVAIARKIEEHAMRDPLDPDRLKKYIELYATIATVVSPTLQKLIEHFGPQIPALAHALGL